MESLQQSVALLKDENEKLRNSIRQHLGDAKADALLQAKKDETDADGLLASSQGIANKVLDDPDFSFIKALQTAQQNFVVTDPSLPDNPIVYASRAFGSLTGYPRAQIVGRNCRFLQGVDTDATALDAIREAVDRGRDGAACVLNYKADGTPFWNQFFVAALRDRQNRIVNYVRACVRASCVFFPL